MGDIAKKQGDHLRRLLENEGVSQMEFAYIVGVSPVTVSRWACGVSPMRRSNAEEISRHYPGYSVEYILGYSDWENENERKRGEQEYRLHYALTSMDAFDNLADLCGFGCEYVYDYLSHGTEENTEPVRVNERCIISKDGKEVEITIQDYNMLVKELLFYVSTRLNGIIERGRW